ncbi:hypothetical protein B0H15DRAFT_926808 [Mycena belliarum]|uniref:Uncharacterized protein n=1 Tax=Mycena belliarum TaxID=1033014 RepID=A0AAD6UFP2_9AGAR|nr:hypothetical protein B0H15DRAFT_926808 [Mycena belliae]
MAGGPSTDARPSQGIITPGPSRRVSRGFFSLFSSSKAQQALMRPRDSNSSLSSNDALPARFDAISLTSPAQRDDPAFSPDPSVHYAHPRLVAPRDFIRTSAPSATLAVVPGSAHAVAQQLAISNHFEETKENLSAHYNAASVTSHSSLALPLSNVSAASTSMSPSSSSSLSGSHPSTPTDMLPKLPEAPELDRPAVVASPVAETFDRGADLADRLRTMSPPPEYETIASPRPLNTRTDSAPQLRHIGPPGLPHRSATAPMPVALTSASRRPNDARPQAYDLDRIDELDESNPLGVALHHEGPFQAIASVLKGPPGLGNPYTPLRMRPAKSPEPGEFGGSLGISPGQVLPRNFPYFQPAVPPPFRQDFGNAPQASTSYLPPVQPSQHNMRAPSLGQEEAWTPSLPNQRPPPAQPPHLSYDARGSYTPPPRVHPAHPSHDAHAFSAVPPQPPPSMQLADASYDLRSSSNPHHTQYNPLGEASYGSAQNGNVYGSKVNLAPPARHVNYFSEDNSHAYGGIAEAITPKRDRRSAPPIPTAPLVPYIAQNDDSTGSSSRRHSAHPGFRSPIQEKGHSTGPNSPNSPRSGNPVFMDSRVSDSRDVEQSSSGIRYNWPTANPGLQQPYPPGTGYSHPPRAGSHARPDERDCRRPSSYQPPPTSKQPSDFYRGPHQQPQVGQDPVTVSDPRRYQPVLPAGAAPADLGRQQLERNQLQSEQLSDFSRGSYRPVQVGQHPMAVHDTRRHQPLLPAGAAPADLGRQQLEHNQITQDRHQNVAPSIASSAIARHGPQPQHIPKHLVMPTPLQQNAQLPNVPLAQSYQSRNDLSGPHKVRFDTPQAQPTRAETIQMVQDGGRHLLRKRSSVPSSHANPSKPPPVTRTQLYMEPPPTLAGPPVPRPAQQGTKRPKRLLSKRRTDL